MPVNIPIRKGLFSTFFTRWQRNGMRAAKKNEKKKLTRQYPMVSHVISNVSQPYLKEDNHQPGTTPHEGYVKHIYFSTHQNNKNQKHPTPISKYSFFFFSLPVCILMFLRVNHHVANDFYVSFINILAQFLSYFFIFLSVCYDEDRFHLVSKKLG